MTPIHYFAVAFGLIGTLGIMSLAKPRTPGDRRWALSIAMAAITAVWVFVGVSVGEGRIPFGALASSFAGCGAAYVIAAIAHRFRPRRKR